MRKRTIPAVIWTCILFFALAFLLIQAADGAEMKCRSTAARAAHPAAAWVRRAAAPDAGASTERETECGILYDPDTGELLPPEQEYPEDVADPDAEDVELLAIAIYCEAGADYISDDTRRMVGDVILNRVNDDRFPDTILDVLTAPRQYGRFAWTGVVWPARASNACEAHAVARAQEIARSLLLGEHSDLYAAGYIWQAEFRQGTDCIKSDGIWFGR